MSERGPERDKRLDGELISELRAYVQREIDKRAGDVASWTARLTYEEIMALLDAAEERDRLAAEACEMPDERPAPAPSTTVLCRYCAEPIHRRGELWFHLSGSIQQHPAAPLAAADDEWQSVDLPPDADDVPEPTKSEWCMCRLCIDDPSLHNPESIA